MGKSSLVYKTITANEAVTLNVAAIARVVVRTGFTFPLVVMNLLLMLAEALLKHEELDGSTVINNNTFVLCSAPENQQMYIIWPSKLSKTTQSLQITATIPIVDGMTGSRATLDTQY